MRKDRAQDRSEELVAATWFALLTSPLAGAIAVTVVVGPESESTVVRHFLSISGTRLDAFEERRLHYGHWLLDDGSPGEDVIICRLAPDRVEIHSHSGPMARRLIHSTLELAGLCQLAPREALRRLAADPWLAEAQWALIHARTARTAQWLHDQLPVWSNFARRAALWHAAGGRDPALSYLQEIIHWNRFALHLVQPWRIVVAGAPNAGKSSLVNRIVGFERALVHHTAGTTRDTLRHDTALDGWPVELIDTAGIRGTGDPIERAGVERAQQSAAEADLVVWVVDATSGPCAATEHIPIQPDLVVINKSDLLAEPDRANLRREAEPARVGLGSWPTLTGGQGWPFVVTSAVTGEGVEELMAALAERLVPALPPAELPLCVTPELVQRIESLRDSLARSP